METCPVCGGQLLICTCEVEEGYPKVSQEAIRQLLEEQGGECPGCEPYENREN
jgi:hypothetical protein